MNTLLFNTNYIRYMISLNGQNNSRNFKMIIFKKENRQEIKDKQEKL